MPRIICPACTKEFRLSATAYWNYIGDVRCTNCGAYLTNIVIENGELKKTPIHKSLALHRIQGTPDALMSDLIEAQRCHAAGIYNASVVMCRRALEQLCIDKQAEGHTLHDKLKSLTEQGILSREISDSSNEIKYFGNCGAHSENDLLGGIIEKDASEVLEICLHIVKHIYEVPQRI